jgi:hypothetical protein
MSGEQNTKQHKPHGRFEGDLPPAIVPVCMLVPSQLDFIDYYSGLNPPRPEF